MSNQSAPAKSDAAKPADPNGPRVPVSLLHFTTERGMPGGQFGSTLPATPDVHPTQKRWLIDFLPRLGVYEIRFYEANATVPAETRLIPKEWASATVVPG